MTIQEVLDTLASHGFRGRIANPDEGWKAIFVEDSLVCDTYRGILHDPQELWDWIAK